MSRLSLSSIFFALLSFAALAGAQVAPGAPSFVPQDCHEVDCVDLLNNVVSLNLPVRSKSGAFPFRYGLNGSYFESVTATNTWQPSVISSTPFLVPLSQTASFPGVDGWGGNSTVSANCPSGPPYEGAPTTKFFNLYIVVAGTYHFLPSEDFYDSVGCINKMVTDTTADDSGYTVTIGDVAPAIYDRSGTEIGYGAITDSNGNKITNSSGVFTDTLGVTALTTSSSTATFPNYSWTDVNGGSPEVSFTTSSTVTLRSVFGCSGITDYDLTDNTLPSAVNFPDGTSLGLTYEGTPGHTGDYTGRLDQITLREGGTITYSYLGSNNGINCTYQTVPELKRVLGNGDTTTYTLAYSLISGSNYKATNTMADPGGNQTIYTFTGLTSVGNSPTYAQVVTEIQRYQGTATLLTTDVYCYNTTFANCSTTAAPTAQVTMPVTSVIVFHKINGMSTWSAQETHFNGYGVSYSASYDFGGTSPVRATTVTYGTCIASCNTSSPTIYSIGSNIYNKPGEVVTTQNGSTVAQANYTYDSHGNLLNKEIWTGSMFIGQTSVNTYNSNGTLATSYDLNNNETTYTYASSGYSDGCGSVTNYPFPNSVTNVGTGLVSGASWDCTGGVQLTAKDANGNITTYCYNTGASCSGGTADPYWRVLQATDPLGFVTVKTYPSGSANNQASTSMLFNSSNSILSSIVIGDPYGRTVDLQRRQSPTSSYYDTVFTSYDWSGTSSGYRQVYSSQPCSVGYNQPCPSTQHLLEFDPLGRLYTEQTNSNETLTHTYTQNDDLSVLTPAPTGENAKQVQTEYDGLGRVTKVCHIGSTAATGSATACGQNTNPTPATGATDAYTYSQGTGYTTISVTRGNQTRTNTYDALGRLTKKVTPEGGTWTYYYDSNASTPCGTNLSRGQKGYLVCQVDPNGDDNVFYYDSMNRITDIGFGVGGSTACRRFRYDIVRRARVFANRCYVI